MKGKVLSITLTAINCAAILCLLTFTFYACIPSKKVDSRVSKETMEPYIQSYWGRDSLGKNGFRELAALVMVKNKKELIGQDAQEFVRLLDRPIDTVKSDDRIALWYRVADGIFLSIRIDRKTQKIIKISTINNEY